MPVLVRVLFVCVREIGTWDKKPIVRSNPTTTMMSVFPCYLQKHATRCAILVPANNTGAWRWIVQFAVVD